MASYSYLIDQMTWSYSRLQQFDKCKYGFLLKYIFGETEEPTFYGSFGSFAHELLADYYSGRADKPKILTRFTTEYESNVVGMAQSFDVRRNFKQQLFDHLLRLERPELNVISVEERFFFPVRNHNFVGIVDLVAADEDGNIMIIDHKSHSLKPFSGRRKPTKTDIELSAYLRQLYLYSSPVAKRYGRFPSSLGFNCYRAGERVVVPFSQTDYEAALDWADGKIDEIRSNTDWEPCLDFFTCKYLCGFGNKCEYFSAVE